MKNKRFQFLKDKCSISVVKLINDRTTSSSIFSVIKHSLGITWDEYRNMLYLFKKHLCKTKNYTYLIFKLEYNNMSDNELIQSLRKYFNVYYKDINVVDGTLFVDIHEKSYRYLINRQNAVDIMNELGNYFNEEGLEFFFPKMYKIYAYMTPLISEDELNKERLKEIAKQQMNKIKKINEMYNYRIHMNSINREMMDLKDHSIKTHCNIGNI